jgi:hypothetical protein
MAWIAVSQLSAATRTSRDLSSNVSSGVRLRERNVALIDRRHLPANVPMAGQLDPDTNLASSLQ